MANLTQLRLLENLDGFLLVDKPAGVQFSTVVKTVKRKFNLVKVGHGGSLDAMASGLLVLLVNDANKFVDQVMGADRSYTGKIRFGVKTNTHDIHGEVVKAVETDANAVAANLPKVLPEFKGDIFQTESRWCSVRRDGTAEYEIADTGDHKQFLAHVYRLAVDGSEFSLKASKSVLVRTLVNDLGDALGCGACLESLRRTAVWKFDVKDAIPFERVLETEIRDFASLVTPVSAV